MMSGEVLGRSRISLRGWFLAMSVASTGTINLTETVSYLGYDIVDELPNTGSVCSPRDLEEPGMAHYLFRGGMAFVGEVPWHGLGEAVASTVTANEMCRAAGLDWKVWREPAPGARVVDEGHRLHDRYLIMREPVGDEDEAVALGMVGSAYKPLQNTEAFEFFEPIIEGNYARFHTAGALGNGERIWVLVKLNDRIVIEKDDIVDRYLLLSNSHDGTGSVSIRFTPIRVVCQNTLNFALKGGSGAISVRHTRNIARHLAAAQAAELKRLIEKAFTEAEMLFGKMALMSLDAQRTNEILELMFPRTERQQRNGLEPERWHRIKHVLEDTSVTPPRTKSTLWALYNAITREEDYRMSREASPESRLERVWFGSGHDLKIRALTICRQEVHEAA